MDKYLDPPNAIEIIEKIKGLPTIGDVKALINEVFPSWWILTSNEYSKDYPHLIQNWKSLCDSIGVKPFQILLVDDLLYDDNHTVIRMFAECLTSSGFIVRRNCDYLQCSICKSCIPSQEIWTIFNQKKLNIPLRWSEICGGCQ